MDITDRKQAEEEKLLMERQVLQSQKLESLGMLAGGIAHDFNNLLMAIIGNIDIAMLDDSSSSEMNSLLTAAQQAARRATGLTKQLLTYSGGGIFTSEPIDLNALISETAHLFEASISKNASLRMDLDPKPTMIEADPSQVQQIIMNLIVNASEAIGDRLGVITLATRTRHYDDRALAQSRLERKLPAGRYVALEVSDTGCGIEGDAMRKLFDPFYHDEIHGAGAGSPGCHGNRGQPRRGDPGRERTRGGIHFHDTVPTVRVFAGKRRECGRRRCRDADFAVLRNDPPRGRRGTCPDSMRGAPRNSSDSPWSKPRAEKRRSK